MVDLVFDIIPQIANESGIYAISNNVDERLYIGRTNNFMRRFFEHGKSIRYGYCSKKMHKFINDNPQAIMSMRLIELVDKDRLGEREEYYIRTLDTVSDGLNTFYTDDELIEFARKFKGKKRNKKKPKRRIGESTMSIKEFVQYLAKRHRR